MNGDNKDSISCHKVAVKDTSTSQVASHHQGLMQAVFDIGILILGTLIWAYPNSIIGKVKTTKKCKTRSNLLGHVIGIS